MHLPHPPPHLLMSQVSPPRRLLCTHPCQQLWGTPCLQSGRLSLQTRTGKEVVEAVKLLCLQLQQDFWGFFKLDQCLWESVRSRHTRHPAVRERKAEAPALSEQLPSCPLSSLSGCVTWPVRHSQRLSAVPCAHGGQAYGVRQERARAHGHSTRQWFGSDLSYLWMLWRISAQCYFLTSWGLRLQPKLSSSKVHLSRLLPDPLQTKHAGTAAWAQSGSPGCWWAPRAASTLL